MLTCIPSNSGNWCFLAIPKGEGIGCKFKNVSSLYSSISSGILTNQNPFFSNDVILEASKLLYPKIQCTSAKSSWPYEGLRSKLLLILFIPILI